MGGGDNSELRDEPQHSFSITELDSELLSTPFGVQTNWHVITGAPCSGKTTLIGELADKGFRTVPESGRICVERELDPVCAHRKGLFQPVLRASFY